MTQRHHTKAMGREAHRRTGMATITNTWLDTTPNAAIRPIGRTNYHTTGGLINSKSSLRWKRMPSDNQMIPSGNQMMTINSNRSRPQNQK